jgi:hypothetical protein
MNNFPSFCVDGFYEDPDYVRELALKEINENPIDVKGVYPGKRTRQLRDINSGLFDKFCHKFFSIFYDMNFSRVRWLMDTTFQLVEPFSKDENSPINRGWVHLDGHVVCAGVVYLTPDININSGTSVFRLDNQDTVNVGDEKKKFYTGGEFEEYEAAINRHNSSYTETVRFNNIYNRIIGFDATSYHGVNSYYDKNQFRLTQVFFVHGIDSNSKTPIVRSKSYG